MLNSQHGDETGGTVQEIANRPATSEPVRVIELPVPSLLCVRTSGPATGLFDAHVVRTYIHSSAAATGIGTVLETASGFHRLAVFS